MFTLQIQQLGLHPSKAATHDITTNVVDGLLENDNMQPCAFTCGRLVW